MQQIETALPSGQHLASPNKAHGVWQKIAHLGLSATLSLAAGGVIESVRSMVNPDRAKATDDGGYPWADAQDIRVLSDYDQIYDWGYPAATAPYKTRPKTFEGQPYYMGDPWAYDVRNCTSYVAWRVKKEFGVDIGGWGNAGYWDTAARGAGYAVDVNGPEPGDLAVTDGEYGHISFVTSVNSDGSVNVDQYNKAGTGLFSHQDNQRADHYIDINGEGVIWNGSSPNTSPPPAGSGNVPYAATVDGQEFYSEEGWVYTRVGGTAFPIKHKNDWTAADTAWWGNVLYGPVPTAEVHDHEAGYSSNGRTVGAHPPVNGTDVYVDGTNQQWYFYNGRAYPIGGGEVDDLGVRDKALRIPSGRLEDFMYGSITLPNGSIYRGAGSPNVKQIVQQPNGSRNVYMVGNFTVQECLRLVQGKNTIILPQSAIPYAQSGANILNQPAACQFPSGWILNGPGGQEQWRIEGDNSSMGYTRRYYPNALTAYLNTSGNPQYATLSSAEAINGITQGPNMTLPNGIFFINTANGDQFKVENGVFRKIPWPDMNACLGNTSPVSVPGNVVGALPQGPQMSCAYQNRIIYGSNGAQYYVTPQGKRQYISTGAISLCIGARRGAGAPLRVSDSDVNAYPIDNVQAYCNYEQEPGLNFVREAGDPTVWLVHPNGTKEHVGSFCVGDPETTQLKRFHLFVVPAGETAGHVNTGVFWANGAICDTLPGAGLIWHS